MRFNTFNDVAKWYANTKPLVSKNHTLTDDVRPIGDRNRKWERIKRIDENTYALCDGNYGNCIWGNSDPAMRELEDTMAPIVWMRREDGDFIRIRNHSTGGCSVTRYNFIAYNLPSAMHFHYNQSGKHYVRASGEDFFLHYHLPSNLRFGYNQQGKHWVRHNGEDLPLPKCKVHIERVSGHVRELRDDDVFLMFRANEDGTFTRVGDKLKVEVQKVDKELKKQWRERLDAFYGYCAAVAPMLDVSWSGKNEYANMIREHLTTPDANLRGAWIRDAKSVPTELVREIVTQEDHPMRVAFAALVIADIGGKRAIESQDDVRQIKATYNRVMNKALGFYKIEEK